MIIAKQVPTMTKTAIATAAAVALVSSAHVRSKYSRRAAECTWKEYLEKVRLSSKTAAVLFLS